MSNSGKFYATDLDSCGYLVSRPGRSSMIRETDFLRDFHINNLPGLLQQIGFRWTPRKLDSLEPMKQEILF
jgi:hypothetical protein